MRPDDFIMPFGKHKGQPLDAIPLTYLDWLSGQDLDRFPGLRRALTAYLTDPTISKELEDDLRGE